MSHQESIIPVDQNRVKHVTEVESSAGQGAGLLELWHGVSQIVWHHAGVCRLSAASGEFGARACCNACANCAIAPKTKKGRSGGDLDVSTRFGPLLEWILAWWPADQPRLALALDATTLKKRFTVLVISVVYRGCAIPVAHVASVVNRCLKIHLASDITYCLPSGMSGNCSLPGQEPVLLLL